MRQSLNFTVVGPRPQNLEESPKKDKRRPWGFVLPGILLLFLVLGCMFAEMVMTHDPLYFNLNHISEPPGPEFLFGTDAMGRDVFSMIWYGGRISLTVGVLAAAVSEPPQGPIPPGPPAPAAGFPGTPGKTGLLPGRLFQCSSVSS